jgi:hypothetical protein
MPREGVIQYSALAEKLTGGAAYWIIRLCG